MGVFRLPDVQLYYQASGEGEPLVLIHGLGSSSADWELQVPEFSRHFRVITPDLRGHGGSGRRGPYSVQQFAADTWALLDQLDIGQPVLLGHSMGGAVAMQMALDRPRAVPKLVLADTVPSFKPRTLGERWMLWSRLLLMGWLGPRRLSEYMNEKLFPRPDQAELRRRVARRNARNDKNAYLGSIRALTQWSIEARVTELSMPVLVVAAEHDYFPRADLDRFVALLPNAQFLLVPDTHHNLPLEAPEVFNPAVLAFLGK